MASRDQWYDDDAGPVVRLYAVTSGRARASGAGLALMAVVRDNGRIEPPRALSPEQRELLAICRVPQTVADVASTSGLPVGVIRVLLDDLRNAGLIAVSEPHRLSQSANGGVLGEVIDGLRTL